MKREAFLRGGVDAYTAPQLELLEIEAELGFAGSDNGWGDGSLDDDWEDLGEI